MLIRLDDEVKSFKEELCKLSWFMRGGVTLNDLMFIYSQDDRDAMYSVINDNIETTKTTQMPLL